MNTGVKVTRAAAWGWGSVLMDVIYLAAVVVSIPFAVLLVGTPVAVAITLLLWLVRMALGTS